MQFSKIALVVLSVGVSAGSAIAHDDAFYGRRRVLEGQRYNTMRALAHYLDERAEHAAEQAEDTAHHGDWNERRFLGSVNHFSRQASDFHDRMDRYAESPWDVAGEVRHLIRDARNVNDRIRRAHALEHTWEDWDSVLDVLDRMQRLLYGEDVRVPPAHRRGWRDYDRDYQGYDEDRDSRDRDERYDDDDHAVVR